MVLVKTAQGALIKRPSNQQQQKRTVVLIKLAATNLCYIINSCLAVAANSFQTVSKSI